MNSVSMFHIAIEFWGIVISLIALFISLVIYKDNGSKNQKLFIQLVCILMLVADIFSWAYNGVTNNSHAYYGVRISTLVSYICSFGYLCIFTAYLWNTVKVPDSKRPIRCNIIGWLSLLGVILSILNYWYGFFYYFDENNLYHRGQAFYVVYLISFIALVLLFTILMQERKRLKRAKLYACIAYFVIPVIAVSILLINTNISLQNVAIVIATQIIFLMDIIGFKDEFDKTSQSLAESNKKNDIDGMTGLLNKSAVLTGIQNHLDSMNDDSVVYLMFLDIDNFKGINDQYGHLVGDFWIKEVANTLKGCCRKDDLISRFGGDEFLVLIKGNPSNESIVAKMNYLNTQLIQKSKASGANVHCSIGICKITGSGYLVDECIDLSDKALYQAKEHGKSNCVLYEYDQHVVKKQQIVGLNKDVVKTLHEIYDFTIVNLFDLAMIYDIDSDEIQVLRCDENLHNEFKHCQDYSDYINKIVTYYGINVDKDKIYNYLQVERLRTQIDNVDYLMLEDGVINHVLINSIRNPKINSQYLITISLRDCEK